MTREGVLSINFEGGEGKPPRLNTRRDVESTAPFPTEIPGHYGRSWTLLKTSSEDTFMGYVIVSWEDVALEEKELRLPEGKTGARVVPLSPSAVKLLAGLPRMEGNPWVIPGRKPGTHMSNVHQAWQAVRAKDGGKIPVHVRCHSAIPGNFHALRKHSATRLMMSCRSA